MKFRLIAGALPLFQLAAAHAAPAPGLSKVPLYFEENRGQTAAEVHFMARADGYTAYLTGREAVLQYSTGKPGQTGKESVVRMSLAGSNAPAKILGGERLSGIVNYLIGNDPSQWHTKIPTWSDVDYTGVYPGIDLVYRGTGRKLEFDFRVAAKADPGRIRLTYAGATNLRLNAAGDLVMDTAAGSVSFLKPTVYQDVDGAHRIVSASYRLESNSQVGFHLGKYDRTRPLVIDPVAASVGPSEYYSTYLGSEGTDTFYGIAADPNGNAYFCGITNQATYPLLNPIQSTGGGNGFSGFITELNAAGTGLVYSTYIAGAYISTKYKNPGTPLAIAVDANGSAFVGGTTDYTNTFPAVNAFQTSIPALTPGTGVNGNTQHMNSFVAQIAVDGASLLYSTYLGGGDPQDDLTGIAVDSSDNAYVIGNNSVFHVYGTPQTNPNSNVISSFPTTAGAIWPDFDQGNYGAGAANAWVAKIAPPSAGGTATLTYATLIGSTAQGGYTYGSHIAADPNGNAYATGYSAGKINHGGVVGTTLTMKNAAQGGGNPWVVEFNSAGSQAPYIAWLGGSLPAISGQSIPSTSVPSIAVDSSGQAYLAGITQANNFQTTSNGYQASPQLAGIYDSDSETYQYDGYITVIGANGASLAYSTYLNGTAVSSLADSWGYDGSPSITGIALGTSPNFTGNVLSVAGYMDTTNFPTLAPSPGGVPIMQTFPGGHGFAMFVTKFQPLSTLTAGSGLIYSAFVGEGDENNVDGIAASNADVFVMINGAANGLTTGGAFDSNNAILRKELMVRVIDTPGVPTATSVPAQAAATSSSAQTVSLTSTVTSSSATVDNGTVTYTVTNSSGTAIGTSVTSGILSGNSAPAASYTLPANTPAGTYTIGAAYNHAGGFLNSSNTGTLTVAAPVQVTVASSPSNLTFSVSGSGCTPASGLVTPQTVEWVPGSSCTVAFTTPQSGATGIQYALSQWEDSSTNTSRTITAPASSATYTATFSTQYELTVATSPGIGGSATPPSATYYNSGAVVNLQATPNANYVFNNWTGSSVANAGNASTTITMNAPESVTANFTSAPGTNVTIASSPSGLSFISAGTGCSPGSYTSPQVLAWQSGSSCTVTFTGTQAGGAGTQYAFAQWEDSTTNPARLIAAPSSAATYTATFNTQYQLTTASSPSAAGSATPVSGQFYNAGSVVNLQAVANSGYTFANWTGGSVASPSSVATTITMTAPQSLTANFTPQFVLNASVTPANGGAITATVNGLPFSCSATCSTSGSGGSSLTLTAAPASGYTFSSWTNCPSPAGSTCTVTLTGTVAVSASFTGSGNLTYSQGVLTLNRTTGLYSRSVTVTNSGSAISASAYVADGLPSGVSLVNASGVTSATSPAGSPYIELGPIGANSSITVTIQFSRTASQSVTYTARILGPGPR